ncbi:MAG: DUF1800 domain-containing protein [Verrucomicrobia bacterium]|nr:DUF1800 domain-containing protein [Cytophagales bacterium]
MLRIDPQTSRQHLYLRAGFGLSAKQLKVNQSLQTSTKDIFDQAKPINLLKVVDENTLTEQKKDIKEILGKTGEERKSMMKDLRKESKEHIRDLNIAWLNQMAGGQASLREKMTLFWHGHFACQNVNAFFVQNQNNNLRTMALGKFSDLLTSVSKDAAMLAFLNNRQNKKNSPNENFAREVMELFTLGRGNYTEQDVKNAARAFTGWNFKPDGSFYFNEKQHDFDEKTFFGKSGKFTGEDVLAMILEKKETAYFLTKKIYKYFVNDQAEEKIVASLAEGFFKSDYDIGKLMQQIFMSDWFYEEKNIGRRIKSPVELLAGLQQTFGLKFQNPQHPLFVQKSLGQVLFYPPNVAGWAEGKSWIDSSSLMFRIQLPELIFKAAVITTQTKEDGDVNTEFLSKKAGNSLLVTADWTAYTQQFDTKNEADLLTEIADYLLQYTLSAKQKTLIMSKADKSSRENLIKSMSIAITTLPEYQLC